MIDLVERSEELAVTMLEAKTHLRVESSEEDAYIWGLIMQAQKQAEDWTGRSIGVHTFDYYPARDPDAIYLERLENDIMSRIVVRKGLVTEIVSIDTYDKSGVETSVSLDDYDFFNSDQTSVILKKDGERFAYGTRDYRDVIVRFRAGYTEDTIPETLRLAVLQLIAFYYENRGEGGSDANLPESIKTLLRQNEYVNI